MSLLAFGTDQARSMWKQVSLSRMQGEPRRMQDEHLKVTGLIRGDLCCK